MPGVELTNMCMVYDRANDKVLVQERVKSWRGISFPGGHVDAGEGIVESVIREIREETGFIVTNLEPCGIIHWYNDETGDRYFVFNFRTEDYEGDLLSETDEGSVFWVDRTELPNLKLSDGLKERLPMFLDGRYAEAFGIWNKHKVGKLTWF